MRNQEKQINYFLISIQKLQQKYQNQQQLKYKKYTKMNYNFSSFSNNFNLLFYAILLININVNFVSAQQNQFYQLQTIINTGIDLTKALAISPIDPQLIVGGSDGSLKVYNYKTGQLQGSMNQQNKQIFAIQWQTDKQGLITLSIDSQTNKSVAVLRKRSTFKQLARWQFNQIVYNMDSTHSQTDTFVGFNFMNRVQQYNIRLRSKSYTYTAYNRKIMDISYASDYSYLHAIVENKYLYYFQCGTTYAQSMSFGSATFLHVQSDQDNLNQVPYILKYNEYDKTQFMVSSIRDYIPSAFPKDSYISYYKYCSKDYIIGVSNDQRIFIYPRDYTFNLFATIDKFINQKINILNLQCESGHLAVSGNNNMVYVFELKPFSDEDQTNWERIWVLIGLGVFVVLIISIVVYRKWKKNKSLREKAGKDEFAESLVSQIK